MKFIALILALALLPSAAAADPATLIITALGGSAALGVVGTALVRIGVAIAFSAIANAIANQNSAPNGGVKTQTTTAGDQTPQSFIMGRYMTAGNLAAPEMSHGVGGDTQYLTRVMDLGDKVFDSIERLIVDGRPVLLDGTEDATFGTGTAHTDFSGALWCKPKMGTQGTADSYLTSVYGAYPERPWLSDMIGRGVPYAIMTFKWINSPQVWQGRPDVKFVVKGIKLYDPRLDTTAGGSGPQRFGDAATHAWSENPVVMIYNILRGITLEGGSTYGGGFDADDLPYATWAAAMNTCDQVIGTRKQYIAGYEVKIASPDVGGEVPLDVIDELLKACSAEIADVGGTMLIRVGGPGLPVKFITDEDILRSSDQDLDPFPAMESSYNGIHATYPEPSELWQVKEALPRYDTAAIARDGGQQIIADMQLPAVTNGSQVQQLMAAWLKDDQRHRRHNITLPPEGILLNPLDVIDWTSARNGYVGKDFEIAQVGIDPATLSSTLAVREKDPADYNWTTGDEITVTPPSLTPVIPAAQTVPGWAVTSTTVKDGAGTDRRPALRLGWNAPLPGVTGIRWQVRVSGTNTIAAEGSTQNVDIGYHVVSEGIVRAVVYEARGRLIGPRDTVWTAWTSVTAPNVSTNDQTGNEVTALLNAAGMSPVEIVNALPSTGNFAGRTVYLTTDAKLYRHTGSPLSGTTGWTAAVPTVDLVGTVNGAQIADGAINTAKFASGIAPVEIVATLPTTGNFEGRTVYLTTDNKLYRHTGAPTGAAGFTVAVDGGDIVAGSIVAGKIAAGAISATEIAAGSIIASKLAVADFTNLVPDSEISDPGVWPAGTGGEYSIVNPSTAGFFSRGHLQRVFVIGTGERAVLSPTSFSVKSGQEYWWQYQVFRSSGTTMRSVAILYWYNASGTLLTTSVFGSFADNTTLGIQTRNGAVTAPAGAVTARWRWWLDASFTDGQVNFGAPEVRLKNGGELIVDGAITTNSLAANAITSDKIAANAITADKIAANAITTGKIAAGAVSATEIAAGAINTSKLAAGAVTAETIAANAITSGKIAADAITADKMAANSITAANAALGNASVDTLQIAGQAVTVPVQSTNTADVLVASAGTVWVEIAAATILRSGTLTRIDIFFRARTTPSGSGKIQVRVLRNGAVFKVFSGTASILLSGSYFVFVAQDTNLGTGSTTYSVECQTDGEDANVSERFLSLLQFKR
jgi:hypothetical protein